MLSSMKIIHNVFDILVIIFFCSNLINTTNAYKFITNKNWTILRSYIKSPETSDSMRQKVNIILFQRHIPLVNKKVNNFKKFHYQKCKHIDKDDLLISAYKGLLDCIRNYNGDFTFYKYLDKYISGSLYDVMTEYYPISKISKANRKKSIFKRNITEKDSKNHGENNIYLSNKDYLQSSSNNHDHEFETMWERIDELEPFERTIFRYKFDFHFNKIRSNIEISKLMSCSEEYVRLSIKNRIKKLCNK